MNIKEKVSRTFADFWSINLGHLCLAATFIFGLGLQWEKASGRMDLIEDRIAVKHEAALNAIAVTTSERDIKFAALTERIVRDEAQVSMIADLRISIATIAGEMKALNGQLSGIRDDLRTNRKPE